MSEQSPFILASASPRRLELLRQIGIMPDQVVAADCDETPLKAELPSLYVMRIAREKAVIVAAKNPGAIVLAADTAVVCGRRILPKAEDEKTARECLKILSGRRHRVYTAICISAGGKLHERSVITQVRVHRLSEQIIAGYLATGEWEGKAGGYAIQGCAQAFIPWIGGSYSGVVGLPLAETAALLRRVGVIK